MEAAKSGPPPERSGAEVDPLHPHHILIHHGYTYLHARMEGSIGQDPEEGLFDFDTRILSYHVTRVAGQNPIGVAAPCVMSERWQAVRTVRLADGSAEGPRMPQDALELSIEQRVGLGMVETLRVRNHSMAVRTADVEIELGADFRDVFEVLGERRQHGTITDAWDPRTRRLTLRYRAEHEGRAVRRGLRVTVRNAWARPVATRIMHDVPDDEVRYRLVFPLELGPRDSAGLELVFDSLVDGRWRSPVEGRTGGRARRLEARDREQERIRERRMRFEARDRFVPMIAEQAADDLLSLRNWDIEGRSRGWLVNAGVPTFTGFFGRDSLSTGIQSAPAGTDILRGAVERAAATQGTVVDDFRDEQPGRIVHEMRRGPLADLGIRPHARYYGSHTGPAAFIIALAEHWRWAGDLDFVRRHRQAADRALGWAERYGDENSDGLLEYRRRSPEGLENQGWKDSAEAIRYPDGRLVEGPIATVEEQALHFLALERMAELEDALGDRARARRHRDQAERLRDLVEDRFWMEDVGFYALAIDSDGRQVATRASNPLQVLAAGLCDPDRAARVTERLVSREFFSGWGIRTLSAEHPSFNPFAYHLGTVWPVESATFAEGAKIYGFDDLVELIVSATFAAAGHCHRGRLPEVLAGLSRDEADFPTTYPNAKSPQAWTASSTLSLLSTMLGLEPFAAERRLALVRPHLPDWLPELTVRQLRVGRATVDLRFVREADGTASHEVLALDGTLDVAVSEVDPGAVWLPRRRERAGAA